MTRRLGAPTRAARAPRRDAGGGGRGGERRRAGAGQGRRARRGERLRTGAAAGEGERRWPCRGGEGAGLAPESEEESERELPTRGIEGWLTGDDESTAAAELQAAAMEERGARVSEEKGAGALKWSEEGRASGRMGAVAPRLPRANGRALPWRRRPGCPMRGRGGA